MNNDIINFIAGIGAGSVSAFVFAPLDVIKTRIQVKSNVPHTIQQIYKLEGIKGFYKGYSASAIIIPVFWSIYFPIYTHTKKYLEKSHSPFVSNSVSALCAGLVTNTITNPLWIVRTRIQTQAINTNMPIHYTDTFVGLRNLFAKEGFTGMTKGLSASLIGTSHAVIQFPLYEYIKSKFPVENSVSSIICSSLVSKLVASTITYPHEVIRSKIQYEQKTKHKVMHVINTIIKTSGYKGFFSGLKISIIRTVPNCIITFLTYEQIKSFFTHQ